MGLTPLARGIPGRERVALLAAVALVGLTVLFASLHTLFGVGGSELTNPIRDWASSAAYVLVAGIVVLRAVRVPRARGPWIAVALGLSLYGAGNLLWALWLEHVESPPIPSVCDALWLSLYPASYVGVVWLARASVRRASAGVWLDGIVAGLGIAAAGAAVVFKPVLDAASGNAVAVATNLAYPIGDLLLAALVMGVLALRGWRLDRSWALIGGGFLVLCVADVTYLRQVAAGSSDSSSLANLFYMSGVGLLALAAWQKPRGDDGETVRLDGWSVLVLPAIFVTAALALLTYDHFHRLDPLALTLSILTVLTALLRTGLTFRDVRALAETRRQALTDELTALPNRRMLVRRLSDALTAARVTEGSVALLVIDLDDFKELNDTLGHHAGDVLLRDIGPRLRRVLRSTDTLARLGGDEFAVILDTPSDERAALRVAHNLRSALAQPFDIEGLRLHVGASVGVSLFPRHGDNPDELLRHADVAMYQAKSARSGCEMYASERDTNSRERLELVAQLRGALVCGELELHFQPKVGATSSGIVGAEALVRWRHPLRGLLPPAEFVPLAEQAGLARPLSQRVLSMALDECQRWRVTGHPIHVSVNLSVPDLLDSALPGQVAELLASRGLPPDALVLEVTETSVLSDPERIGNVLARLGELGVGVSLDDFGTGYSSLTHLKTLPVGEVKIDRSFVSRMQQDPIDAAIVGSTIHLAHSLGMRVVAEGVEDTDTWHALAELGCELIQGFAAARPMPATEFEVLLAASPRQRDLGVKDQGSRETPSLLDP